MTYLSVNICCLLIIVHNVRSNPTEVIIGWKL